MKKQSRFVLTCALLATAAGIVGAPRAHAAPHELLAANSSAQDGGQDNSAPSPYGAQSNASQPGAQPRTAVVLRFAVESQPMTGTPTLSTQACPASSDATASPTNTSSANSAAVDPKILDAISAEMQKRLSKKMFVMVDPDPTEIPIGALVISGCITKANAGNAGSRWIGMNVGASHLDVHVVALSKTKDGWSPVNTFDIQVKGGDALPPLGAVGLAVNATKDSHQNLSGDANKVADRIVKKLSKDMNAREEVAKA
jgi:hypothetical protein